MRKKKMFLTVCAISAMAFTATMGTGKGDMFHRIADFKDATVHAATVQTLVSTDGKWEFKTDGTITKYLGNEADVEIPYQVEADGVAYEIHELDLGFMKWKTPVEKITIHSNITNMVQISFLNIAQLREIQVDEDNTKYCSIDGVLYNKAKTVLLKLPPMNVNPVLDLPDTVTKFEMHATENNQNVKNLRIPAAFTGTMSYACFTDFAGLASVDVDKNNTVYASDNGVLYNKDMTYLKLYPSQKKDESYTIPDGVETIGQDAFINAVYLKNLSLDKDLNDIIVGAFSGCQITSFNNASTREEYWNMDPSIRKVIQDNLSYFEGLPFTTSIVEQEIDYAIDTYITKKGLISEYDKLYALYDYATQKVSYDHANMKGKENHCPASLFMRDKTVCEGYAYAMSMLLDRVGIRNELIVDGNVQFKVTHAWNVVQLNGVWLHIDACWDDDEENEHATKNYFLVTTKELEPTAHPSRYWICRSDFQNYYWCKGKHEFLQQQNTPDCNPVFGDLDRDGVLTNVDYNRMADEIRRFDEGITRGVSYYNVLADMNRDGVIDQQDDILLKQAVNEANQTIL